MVQGTKHFTITELKGEKPELVQSMSLLFQLYSRLTGWDVIVLEPRLEDKYVLSCLGRIMNAAGKMESFTVKWLHLLSRR